MVAIADGDDPAGSDVGDPADELTAAHGEVNANGDGEMPLVLGETAVPPQPARTVARAIAAAATEKGLLLIMTL
jgi:hypothetical protein